MLERMFSRFTRKSKTASVFRRSLDDSAAAVLAKTLSEGFGRAISPADVQGVVAAMNRLESHMIGRIAGDVDDHVLNYFMRYYSSSGRPFSDLAKPAQLEIGTLFGGSLLMTLAATAASGSDMVAVCIDPLDGYYVSTDSEHASTVDVVTKLPIDRATVEANVTGAGFSLDKVQIIQSYSNEPAAVSKAAKYDVVSLWIDGDHSYAGLKSDWELYSPLVVSSGYVLIDNYRDEYWPDVTRYIDEELIPNLHGWKRVCELNRSLLFQRD